METQRTYLLNLTLLMQMNEHQIQVANIEKGLLHEQ